MYLNLSVPVSIQIQSKNLYNTTFFTPAVFPEYFFSCFSRRRVMFSKAQTNDYTHCIIVVIIRQECGYIAYTFVPCYQSAAFPPQPALDRSN